MWPRQMHLNLVALLGKPGGGERGIAKTPMLYRTWSRIVQKEVRDWEAAVVADWDCATVGNSAFKTALLRNYKAEIASALGESCAANLWDLHKFFDTVVPSELFTSALELGFPKHVLALGLDMHMAPRVIQLEGCCSEPTYCRGEEHPCWVRVVDPLHSCLSENCLAGSRLCYQCRPDRLCGRCGSVCLGHSVSGR